MQFTYALRVHRPSVGSSDIQDTETPYECKRSALAIALQHISLRCLKYYKFDILTTIYYPVVVVGKICYSFMYLFSRLK